MVTSHHKLATTTPAKLGGGTINQNHPEQNSDATPITNVEEIMTVYYCFSTDDDEIAIDESEAPIKRD